MTLLVVGVGHAIMVNPMIKSHYPQKKHPVRGYATEKEWEVLKTLPPGLDKDFLLKKIQQRSKGKKK